MGTTASKLAKLAETKEAIRTAINDKGVEVSTDYPFASYPEKIAEIETDSAPKVEVIIECNLSDVEFKIEYMNSSIQQESVIVGVGTHKLPIVTAYPVAVTALTTKSGYGIPNKKTKSVMYDKVFNMEYFGTGQYIQADDMNLYTYDEWNSTEQYNHKAVNLVIIRSDRTICYPAMYYGKINGFIGVDTIYSKTDTLIEGIVTTTNYITAQSDYNGLGNTIKIIEQLGVDQSPAAAKCVSLVNQLGVPGYFPSLGEIEIMYDIFNPVSYVNYKDWQRWVNTDMSNHIKTSTQFNQSNAYVAGEYYDEDEDEYYFQAWAQGKTYYNNDLDSGDLTRVIPFYPFVSPADCKKIIISSNIESATFTISYSTIFGLDATTTVSAGEYNYPIDTSKPVTVTGQFISGYGMPSKTLTAVEDYTFDMEYKLPGVYIRHIDGKEYTTDEWTNNGFANDEADCIAVRAGGISFGLNTSGGISTYKWSASAVDVEGLAEFTSSSLALLDYNGKYNTDKIAAQIDSPAVTQCLKKTSPAGNQRYLPSVGEMHICADNIDEITSALTAIGVTISTKNLWTSTEYSSDKAWVAKLSGAATTYTKTSAVAIWPFIVLPD